MQIPSHDDHRKRLHALVEDALDALDRDYSDGYELGVVGFVYEIQLGRDGGLHLKRSDAGYTPDDDVYSPGFGYYVSDHRPWVQEKMFEDAAEAARQPSPAPADEEDSEATDSES